MAATTTVVEEPTAEEAARRKRTRHLLMQIVRVLLVIVFAAPMVFMFMSSFKPDAQIFRDIPGWRAFSRWETCPWTTTAASSTGYPSADSCSTRFSSRSSG